MEFTKSREEKKNKRTDDGKNINNKKLHTIIKKVWEFYYDFIKKKKNNIYCIQCIFVNISIYTYKR